MGRGQVNHEETARIAVEALNLCRSGDEVAGLALYRTLSWPPIFGRLPLGFHIHILREAGRDSAAEALTALTLRWGGNLAWKALRDGASPEMAVAEYREWIGRGQANPLMINHYAVALTRLGRTDEVAALFDSERLIRRMRIGDAEAVAQALLDREPQEIGSRRSVRDMREILGIDAMPEFAPLMAECRTATAAYYADWAASDHPLASLVPRDFSIGAWGLISRGEGYNWRHQHPIGWATGVYYPIGLSPDLASGALRIGGWKDPAPPGWPDATIYPEAGLLVLIPSYFVHWTDPLGAPGLRMSIAYDAMPA